MVSPLVELPDQHAAPTPMTTSSDTIQAQYRRPPESAFSNMVVLRGPRHDGGRRGLDQGPRVLDDVGRPRAGCEAGLAADREVLRRGRRRTLEPGSLRSPKTISSSAQASTQAGWPPRAEELLAEGALLDHTARPGREVGVRAFEVRRGSVQLKLRDP